MVDFLILQHRYNCSVLDIHKELLDEITAKCFSSAKKDDITEMRKKEEKISLMIKGNVMSGACPLWSVSLSSCNLFFDKWQLKLEGCDKSIMTKCVALFSCYYLVQWHKGTIIDCFFWDLSSCLFAFSCSVIEKSPTNSSHVLQVFNVSLLHLMRCLLDEIIVLLIKIFLVGLNNIDLKLLRLFIEVWRFVKLAGCVVVLAWEAYH